MENQEFQELVIAHFKEVSENFGKVSQRFDQIDQRLDQLDGRLNIVEGLVRQHHEELEEVATQIEQSMVSQMSFQTETRNALEKMQHDINYLVRTTATHDDDIIQLKKANRL